METELIALTCMLGVFCGLTAVMLFRIYGELMEIRNELRILNARPR